MPQSQPALHFETPILQNARPYEIPPLPPLWSLWDAGTPDAIGRHDVIKVKSGTETELRTGSDLIPDEARCRELWDHYAMFEHIRRHSQCVADVATALARRAVEQGFWSGRQDELVALTQASGLLHDIAKSYTVQYGGSHAQTGASWIIASTGNHRIAQAVYHHVEWPWELPEDLVHPVFFVLYADKRARHDELVTLEERYVDLMERYGKTEHSRIAIRRGREHALTIERALSAQLEFPLHESTVVGGWLVKRA